MSHAPRPPFWSEPLLRARKETMAQDDYEAALEKLLLELARIDRALKNKS
jgi:hypothetical protein